MAQTHRALPESLLPPPKPPSSLETLPFELLEDIAALACIDGGYTGCSLSHVSRRIRHASSGFRFHSIALRSGIALQVSKFLSLYTSARAEAPQTTPKLRHLYISEGVDDDLDCGCQAISTLRERTEFLEGVSALLQIVAPELETMNLEQCVGVYCAVAADHPLRLPEVEFPALRELTIVGRGVVFSSHEGFGRNGVALYPCLTRLCLVDTTTKLAQWAECAPCLTHLRVCGADDDDNFAQELKDTFCSPSDSPPLFPDLKQLVVQPYRLISAPVPGDGGYFHYVLAAEWVRYMLEELLGLRKGMRPDIEIKPTKSVNLHTVTV